MLLEIILFSLQMWYISQNRSRDRKVDEGEIAADVTFTYSFEDVTDRVRHSIPFLAESINLV